MAVHPKDVAYLSAVVPKRIQLFESIQVQQQAARLSLPSSDPIRITLEDGTVKEGQKGITAPFDIACEISKSLASNSVISKVNGFLWDMNRPLESDCKLKIFTLESFEDNEDVRHTFWHSSSHILGQALEAEYGCKLCIGPCARMDSRAEDSPAVKEGFYYDAFYGDLGLNDGHFKHIESLVEKAVKEKQPFERIEVSKEQALEMFSDNQFKVEIIHGLPVDKAITVYRCGPLVDLCRGPHLPNTSFVKALACMKASSAYWKGDKNRESLQRVYGLSFPDKKRLKAHIKELEEKKKYDHRVLGKNHGLFFFDPVSPGSCFFPPKGALVYEKLVNFIKKQYRERGYQQVITPNLYNNKLWETSEHAKKYTDNMFFLEVDKQVFGLKPMNCPGHCVIFKERTRSYKELPLRIADFGVLHRNESSGALGGLTRVRRFQQDDAHIFCRESQIKDEVKGALEFLEYTYKIFGFTFKLNLSTMPEDHIGDLATWEKAEATLREALDEFGKPWGVKEGDGAFYGPKIDITLSDAMNRHHQLGTLQLDFQLPQRFDLRYCAEGEEVRMERPVMIHRAILGSVERMFALLLEHYKGKWPFWLSPCQAIVCPVSEKFQAYAQKVRDEIHRAGYDVDLDISDKTLPKRVREAEMAHYNYILVVGAEEVKNEQVNLRFRDKDERKVMSLEDLLQHFKKEVEAFH